MNFEKQSFNETSVSRQLNMKGGHGKTFLSDTRVCGSVIGRFRSVLLPASGYRVPYGLPRSRRTNSSRKGEAVRPTLPVLHSRQHQELKQH